MLIYKCISYKDNVKDDLRPVVRATMKDLDQKLLNKFFIEITSCVISVIIRWICYY